MSLNNMTPETQEGSESTEKSNTSIRSRELENMIREYCEKPEFLDIAKRGGINIFSSSIQNRSTREDLMRTIFSVDSKFQEECIKASPPDFFRNGENTISWLALHVPTDFDFLASKKASAEVQLERKYREMRKRFYARLAQEANFTGDPLPDLKDKNLSELSSALESNTSVFLEFVQDTLGVALSAKPAPKLSSFIDSVKWEKLSPEQQVEINEHFDKVLAEKNKASIQAVISVIDTNKQIEFIAKIFPTISFARLEELSLVPDQYKTNHLFVEELLRSSADLQQLCDTRFWKDEKMIKAFVEKNIDFFKQNFFLETRLLEPQFLMKLSQNNLVAYLGDEVGHIGHRASSKESLFDVAKEKNIRNIEVLQDLWDGDRIRSGKKAYMQIAYAHDDEVLCVVRPLYSLDGKRRYEITPAIDDYGGFYAEGDPSQGGAVYAETDISALFQDKDFQEARFFDQDASAEILHTKIVKEVKDTSGDIKLQQKKIRDGENVLQTEAALVSFLNKQDKEWEVFTKHLNGKLVGTAFSFHAGNETAFYSITEVAQKDGILRVKVIDWDGQHAEWLSAGDFTLSFAEYKATRVYNCAKFEDIPSWFGKQGGPKFKDSLIKDWKKYKAENGQFVRDASIQGQKEALKYIQFSKKGEKSGETKMAAEILGITRAGKISFRIGQLTTKDGEKKLSKSEKDLGLSAEKEKKITFEPVSGDSGKVKEAWPWEFLNLPKDFSGTSWDELSLISETITSKKDHHEKHDNHGHHAGGILNFLESTAKSGLSIASFLAAGKTVWKAIEHEIEHYGEAKTAAAMEKLVSGMKGLPLADEIYTQIMLESAQKTKKLTEDLVEKIDKKPGKKKHQHIAEILLHQSAPAWEVRAALLAQVQGYGVLYCDAGLETSKEKRLAYRHLEGTLAWYKRLNFRHSDRWLREYQQKEVRDKGNSFSEIELIMYAAKMEFGEMQVLGGFWKQFQKTVDKGQNSAREKMKDDVDRMDRIQDVNEKILSKFSDGEYEGGFYGLKKAWDLDSDRTEINRMPFLMLIGGPARHLRAQTDGIRSELWKAHFSDTIRIPMLRYLGSEADIQEFQNFIVAACLKKASILWEKRQKDSEKNGKWTKMADEIQEYIHQGNALPTAALPRKKLFTSINTFWSKNSNELLDILSMKDSLVGEMAKEGNTLAQGYAKNARDVIEQKDFKSLETQIRYGYIDNGSFQIQPGYFANLAFRRIFSSHLRTNDEDADIIRGLADKFSDWAKDIKNLYTTGNEHQKEEAKRQYRNMHKGLAEGLYDMKSKDQRAKESGVFQYLCNNTGFLTGVSLSDVQFNNFTRNAFRDATLSVDGATYKEQFKKDEQAFFEIDSRWLEWSKQVGEVKKKSSTRLKNILNRT